MTESSPVFELRLPRGRRWRLGPRPAVLGVLNVTPDSFSDAGTITSSDDGVRAALGMLQAGADAVDIGGESTRPGARPVATKEQLRRVLPILRGLRGETDAPISVDTQDPLVGEAVLEHGADIINDVSACRDPGWLDVLRGADIPVVLMHMRGTPADMQSLARYPDGVLEEVHGFLSQRLDSLEQAGVARDRTIIDPGIGFAKSLDHNLDLLRNIGSLRALGRPIMVGVSRKSCIAGMLGGAATRPARDRDVATVAVNAFLVQKGALILRVHNVAYTRDLVAVYESLTVGDESHGGKSEEVV